MSRQLSVTKTRKYSPSKLENAVRMVESGAMSRKRAALTYGVPRTTLIDKLSGRYKLGSKPGRRTVLTGAEEQCLVDYCKLMSSIGYPLKKAELLAEVKRVLDHDCRENPFKCNLPGKDWFYSFCRRHPELSQRSAMALGQQRAIINQDMIDGWFNGLSSFLQKEVPDWENIMKDPRRSINAGESGFPLCVSTGKVIAEKGARHVYQVTSGTKQQLTVMACFNAFGEYVEPLIVFPGERFRDSGIQDFPEAIYGHTQNGWMDSDLFVEFLKHFNSFLVSKAITKPVILYVDGHSTHMSLDAATFCNENGIILYCLFPNATHVLQPCDVGFFGPMKSAWKKEVKEWHIKNIGQTFTKKHFPSVFKRAWHRVAKLENAVHGFERCGLFPLCPKNIDITKLNPSKIHTDKSNTQIIRDVSKSPITNNTSVKNQADSSPLTSTNAPSSSTSSCEETAVSVPKSHLEAPEEHSVHNGIFTVASISQCESNGPQPPAHAGIHIPFSVLSVLVLDPTTVPSTVGSPTTNIGSFPVSSNKDTYFASPLQSSNEFETDSISSQSSTSVLSMARPMSALSVVSKTNLLPRYPKDPLFSYPEPPCHESKENASRLTFSTITTNVGSACILANSPVYSPTPLVSNPKSSDCALKLNDRAAYVSPSFSLLSVPEIKKKKTATNYRQNLPKALSGSEALKMMKDREEKKRASEEAKLKRKQERETKGKEREEAKVRKSREREEKKRQREEMKKAKAAEKRRNVKRRRAEDSSSESDFDMPKLDDSDDEYDETLLCPGCLTDDGDGAEWVKCKFCPRHWHISCTGDALLSEIPLEQLKEYPFMCEFCKN